MSEAEALMGLGMTQEHCARAEQLFRPGYCSCIARGVAARWSRSEFWSPQPVGSEKLVQGKYDYATIEGRCHLGLDPMFDPGSQS
jgi:hypothetical protein